MIEKIAELVRDKRIEGISDIRDESSREGMRVVIELRREAVADVVLNQLYRYSPLQTSFGCNMVALSGGKPELLTLKDMLQAFVNFREEVVTRRTKFLLAKARDRAHILVGLAIAVANIDEVIRVIRESPDPATAKQELMTRFWEARDMEPLVRLIADPRHVVTDNGTMQLSEEQARAILDLRLQRLTALGRDEIGDELKELGAKIEDYLDILRSRMRVQQIVKDEMLAAKAEFGTPRRTEIVDDGFEVEDEDLIAREDMVVTVSHSGYIKRVPLSTYRAQRRGGKGRSGVSMKDEDFVSQLFVADTHTPVLFFSSTGMVYRMKVWRLPLGTPQSRGKALVNLLPLKQGETITTILFMPTDEESNEHLHLVFATRSGNVRRNSLADFVNINRAGKIAMKLEEEGDAIVGVAVASDQDDIMLTTANGRCIRFPVDDVRVFAGRTSTGVRGIRLGSDPELGNDKVIALTVLRHSDASPAEARAYLKLRRAMRGEDAESVAELAADNDGEGNGEEGSGDEIALSPERYAQLSALEQTVLTVSENGYGKRSSSYEYRVTGRGGKGIIAMAVNERNGRLVASFPVEDNDQIMLVTDAGKLIRCPVHDIRVAGRATQGVTIFNTADDERVVSVAHLAEVEDGGEGNGNGDDAVEEQE